MSQKLVIVGLSHHTSPLSLRERVAVPTSSLRLEVRDLVQSVGLPEAAIVSTCNRLEVYAGVEQPDQVIGGLHRWMQQRGGPEATSCLYTLQGARATHHAFRVASSLDSMVVGEPQILGQLKEAYNEAKTGGGLGNLLDRCFNHAFSVAKRVRHETKIAEGSVSISSIACDLARKIFGDLNGKRVLLIGAGKMGEGAARYLREEGADLYVVNRNRNRAEELAAKSGGQPRTIEDIGDELALADVAIASTSSRDFLITPEMLRKVIRARRHRPLFLIDIAVPRNVDPRVGSMDNVFLYDIDDLQKVAEENLATRKSEAEKAEEIVTHEVVNFEKWRKSIAVTPIIVGLRHHVRSILEEEYAKTKPKLQLDDEGEQAIERMLDSMVNKVLHSPVSELKASALNGHNVELAQSIRRLFQLPSDDDDPAPDQTDLRNPKT